MDLRSRFRSYLQGFTGIPETIRIKIISGSKFFGPFTGCQSCQITGFNMMIGKMIKTADSTTKDISLPNICQSYPF